MMHRTTILLAALVGADALAQPWFQEAAAERGIDFAHDSGHRDRHWFPECICGGCALADFDNDGDLDAYLVNAGVLFGERADRPPNRLYLNDGAGRFTDHTEASATGDRGYGIGVTCADYDADGFIDIYVTNFGANVLYRNNGDATFTDVTADAGVGHEGWGSSAAFVDYDNDGDLDLYVANYVNWTRATEIECYAASGEPDYCSPKNYNAPAQDVLYRNDGDGTFTDVSREAGLDIAFGNGLGVVCADFDDNGWIDLFIANDGTPDQLWQNQGDGTFKDIGMVAGVAIDWHGQPKAGMGTDAVDIDDDGDVDILVVNLANETDSFYRNEGAFFLDETAMIGLGTRSRPFTRFGVAFVDLDHDGLLDLFQATGRVMKQSELYSDDPYAEPNLLMRGTPSGRFEPVEPRGGTAEPLLLAGRGAAFGDVDNDGDEDVLVVNKDGPASLLINVAEKNGNALQIRVLGADGRDALGSSVLMSVGERRLRREVRVASSYCSANDPRVHVGLGDADRVTDVVVRWPDGATEAFGDLAAGALHTLRRGEGG
jgi:hypothetical protein